MGHTAGQLFIKPHFPCHFLLFSTTSNTISHRTHQHNPSINTSFQITPIHYNGDRQVSTNHDNRLPPSRATPLPRFLIHLRRRESVGRSDTPIPSLTTAKGTPQTTCLNLPKRPSLEPPRRPTRVRHWPSPPATIHLTLSSGVAKDSNTSVGTRASAAKDAVGDKMDESGHGVCSRRSCNHVITADTISGIRFCEQGGR